MALKEKALRRLGEKLTAANIPFAAGGEWLHCQLGQSARLPHVRHCGIRC